MDERFLELTQLGKSYPSASGAAVIVRDFNLRVREGEFICLIGHSGCGKSTVLSIVMGLAEASEGGVVLAGREVVGPGLDRGVVFQSPALLPWLTVHENVLLAVDQVARGISAAARRQRAMEYLERVGLGDCARRHPNELSAGMRQRVGIARAFAIEPKVLLLDEPFSLLDALTRMELQDELMRLWEAKRTTVLMVTHDVDEALLLADRIVMMTSGPAATIGDEMSVPLERPRRRAEALDDPRYYTARDRLLGFLEAATPEQAEEEPSMSASPHGAERRRRAWWPAARSLPGEARRSSRFRRAARVTTLVLLLFASVGAQGSGASAEPLAIPPLAVKGPYDSTIRLEVFNRLRGEFVDWFAPKPGAPAPTYRYNFIGNKFQLGVRVNREPYELFAQFQDSAIGNLPDDGVGVGSTYYANTNRTTQNGTFLRNAWLSTTRLGGVQGLSLKGGRQLYSDGAEAKAQSAALKWIQQWRISQRLLGPFDYTHVGRSFDGGVLAYGGERGNATAFFFLPTYGGFAVNANRQLNINTAGVSLNLNEVASAASPVLENSIGRLFWLYYDDNRDVVFLDNRPLAARQADRGKPAVLHTIGASFAHVEALGPGHADGLAYGFGQMGEWQSQMQRSWAYGLEVGYRLEELWADPWMRVGINSASGDQDPNDNLHQTFFQMLPTAWLYAQFPFYNMMNNQDVFAQWILDPDPRLTFRLDFHWLRVNSGADLAYFGGGATKNDFFGFGGVPANGRNELAYLVSFLLTVRPTAFLSFNGFYAHAFGQGVIAQTYAGNDGNYGYLEAVVAF